MEDEFVHVSCIAWGKPMLRTWSEISEGVPGVDGLLEDSRLKLSSRDGTKGGNIIVAGCK